MYHRVHKTKIRLRTVRLVKVSKNLSGNLLVKQAESPSWRQSVSEAGEGRGSVSLGSPKQGLRKKGSESQARDLRLCA